MKKLMVLCSSPRKMGNTERVARWAMDAAKSAGADVEFIHLADLNYKTPGCTACMGCKKIEEYRCVVDDDATPILARIPDADAVLLAMPVYFFGPNAQMKVFFDRAYSLLKFDPERAGFIHNLDATRFGVIATAGGGDEAGLANVEAIFDTASKFMGISMSILKVPYTPQSPEQIEENGTLRAKAEELGRQLIS